MDNRFMDALICFREAGEFVGLKHKTEVATRLAIIDALRMAAKNTQEHAEAVDGEKV